MSDIKGGIDQDGPPVDTIQFFTAVNFASPLYVKIYRSRTKLSLAITIDDKPYQPRFPGLTDDYYKIAQEFTLQ